MPKRTSHNTRIMHQLDAPIRMHKRLVFSRPSSTPEPFSSFDLFMHFPPCRVDPFGDFPPWMCQMSPCLNPRLMPMPFRPPTQHVHIAQRLQLPFRRMNHLNHLNYLNHSSNANPILALSTIQPPSYSSSFRSVFTCQYYPTVGFGRKGTFCPVFFVPAFSNLLFSRHRPSALRSQGFQTPQLIKTNTFFGTAGVILLDPSLPSTNLYHSMPVSP